MSFVVSSRNVAFIFIVIICSVNLRAQLPVNVSDEQNRRQTDDLTAQGISAFQSGEMEKARQLLEQALRKDPKNSEAHTFLGILDDNAGNFESAEKHFAAAVRLVPDSASARNNHGAILLRLNRRAQAKSEFEASLKIDPDQPNALVNLAQIFFAEDTPQSLRAALNLFEKADSIAPDAAVARSLVIIALKLKEKEKTSEFYRNYALRLEKSDEIKPDADSRAELGGALYEAGLLAEAEAELKAALDSDPSNSDTIARLGRVYLARDDISSAGKTLETAVARGYSTAAIYSLLAVVYEKIGRYDNAIPAMRLAINLEPESEKYRFQYGLLLTNAEAPAAALIRIDEALKTFPNSSRLWLARGIAELKSGKNNDAAKSINHAIELDPDFAQAYAYLGLVRVQIGQFNVAIELYEKALQKDPTLSAIHQMIADVMLQQTDADNRRIESELKKSIASDPTFTLSYLALGKLYIRMSRWNEAVEYLEKTVKLEPDLAEAYYQLGRVYARLKRKDESAEALDKFKTLSETQKKESDTQLRELVKRLANVRF
ncbi:MAG: tetratricopeptide repeat protein [Pyrinomonadaceae bacterium]